MKLDRSIARSFGCCRAILIDEIIGLNDSKVLSDKKEKLFEEITKKKISYSFTDAKTIDEKGLSYCLKNSILEIMEALKDCDEFLMDGNTTFGISGLNCK